MNITIIPISFLPKLGGVEVGTYKLAQQFLKRNHKVNIITRRHTKDVKPSEEIDDIPVDRLAFQWIIPPGLNLYLILRFLINLIKLPFVVFRLCRLLKKYNTDIVNVQYVEPAAPYVWLASFFIKFKLVVSLQAYSVVSLPHLSKYNRWMFNKILKRASYVTACSNYLFLDAKKRLPEIEKKSCVIYNGVNLEEFESHAKHKHDKPYILSLGRLSPEKGFDILPMAFREIVDAKCNIDLIIAGEGEEDEYLEKINQLLGLRERVLIFGPAKREEVVRLFNGCEFFVMPSRIEPLGIVNLEAMAAGKAIVAAKSAGVPEIVKDGENGILVKPNSVDSLAVGMMRLLKDKDLRDRLGQHGREFVKQFDWDRISELYLDLFSSL